MREKRQNGQKEDKRFDGEGGTGVLHRPRGSGLTVELYRPEGSEEEVTVLQYGVTVEVTVLQAGDSSRRESCQEEPWESQQSFRPNPNRVGDRTPSLRQLLIRELYSL